MYGLKSKTVLVGCPLLLAMFLMLTFPALSFAEPLSTPLLAQAGTAPQYRPPLRGAPVGRMGGGTRGSHADLPVLMALTPDHTGLTVSASPVLHWYISDLTSHTLEFVLIDHKSIEPLAEIKLAPPAKPGIQAIRLADLGIQLATDVAYKWFVALIPDAGQRSRDILAGGLVERLELSEKLAARLTAASPLEKCGIYAESGLWYDALAAISEEIARHPESAERRAWRQALLKQVGLESQAF